MEGYFDILAYPMWVTSLVFYYLTLILGVPGNAFVVYVAGLKMKRTVNTVGFLNLAIADLLCCLCSVFYVIRSVDKQWPYGSIMCKLLPFIMLITMFTSVFTLSLISLDRFTQISGRVASRRSCLAGLRVPLGKPENSRWPGN
ncbi:hypothetical protein QQF64_002839 [Cirrhinus molitorella]|uniref:G-protein coupled receptors family 1 profile domain-containing protein n=1 Tax=Cirrhinus molitorella TaxID=172907 RepID=A0ABR3MRA8_9TELE